MNKIHTPYLILLILILTVTTGCDNTTKVPEVKSVGIEAIDEILLSPQSPVLIADGKSELTFNVRCYYTTNGVRAHMLEDRVPWDQITITSSEGKTIPAKGTYSTTSDAKELTFTAKLGSLTSRPVSVTLYPASSPTYEPTVVPVRMVVFYEKKNASSVESLTKELIQQQMERVNKVFSGTFAPKSSSLGSTGLSFEVKQVDLKTIDGDLLDYYSFNKLILPVVKKSYMDRADKELTIWVVDGRLGRNNGPYDCRPAITTGSPEDLKGLKLEKKEGYTYDPKATEPNQVGLFMSTYQLFACINNSNSDYRWETILGSYYGLLSTGGDPDDPNQKYADDDYCPDTFTYKRGVLTREKRTFPLEVKEEKDAAGKVTSRKEYYYVYVSTNIMDEISSCSVITRDQAARIRQVIRDCPLRRQGLSK